jgi:hypothetical protein
MLSLNAKTGELTDPQTGTIYADRPYEYSLTGTIFSNETITDKEFVDKVIQTDANKTTFTGTFPSLGIKVLQEFAVDEFGLQETVEFQNIGTGPVSIKQISLGFCADLRKRSNWRLCAIPFKVQLDGSRHDYSGEDLSAGQFKNAVFEDSTRKFMPPLTEEGCLRSEAWAWGSGSQGLLVIKYNNQQVELSVVCPDTDEKDPYLRFGGAGICLYSEPSGVSLLEPGQRFIFGTNYYIPYENGLEQAFYLYRNFLNQRGHTFPADYNPPINWNELYDLGWYHSRPEELKQFYTRESLLNEAAKASEIGCELLYLDPGWEVCEGTTLWDEARLGTVKSLVETLEHDYGLGLGYRTILRTYQDHWPHKFLIQHNNEPYEEVDFGGQYFWEPCLCNPEFWQEKLNRILAISRNGIRFMMVDEFDWRGPCYNPSHGHPVPTAPIDHILADYRLCKAIREANPSLTIEAHDPVWPWSSSIYVPTYFQHGFGPQGSYDENWGFEYMWDCLNDLKSGRALALYYYNLGCNVPIYLHITMAADNDACVFFWWVASTVRHLGIGGKKSNKTIEPGEGLPQRDSEARFEAYKEQMKVYKRLKPYFVRGSFYGIAENAHLHTLPEKQGGVLNVFNLTQETQDYEFFLPSNLLGTNEFLSIHGANPDWRSDGVLVRLKLNPMSPAVICIGDANV